jgi:hypothetical protein
LTRLFAKLSISPESSDGFASVGTILPKEEATLLPGGLFALLSTTFVGLRRVISASRKTVKKITSIFEDPRNVADALECKESYAALRTKRHSMSNALHPALQILIALSLLAILVWPTHSADEDDLNANDFDITYFL